MRKLKLQIQMTIDGFVAGPNGENDWVFISGPDEAGFQKIMELVAGSDTLLLGRKLSREFIGHCEKVADAQPDGPQKTYAQGAANYFVSFTASAKRWAALSQLIILNKVSTKSALLFLYLR